MEQATSTDRDIFKKVISHAKEYGFVFPSSEIYDGLQAVYDYGQYGAELRNNLRSTWWKAMTLLNDNVVGIDAAIFMHPLTWKASGHVDNFNDPMIDNKDSKKRYRADVLIENKIQDYYGLGEEEINKKHGFYPGPEIYLISTNQSKRFSSIAELGTFIKKESISYSKFHELNDKLNKALNNGELSKLYDIIVEEKICCPISGTCNWTDVRQFNLMFSTQVGSVAEESSTIYLRPETAQGIFVNFLNVQKTGRMKIPFGIAQTGKAFRNEIVARQFIFRMREFEQMEMQYFVRPGEEMKWYEHWKETRMRFHKAIGLPAEKLRYKKHEKLAHYANAAVDIEFEFPFGFKEMEGIHSRTDFDLKQHQELSGKKMQYFDAELDANGKPYGNYVPYVVETSVGLDRLFLATLCNAFTEEVTGEGETRKERTFLKFHPALAPIKIAVFPLTKKDGLPDKAKEIIDMLKFDFKVTYEEKDTIGKRYTRQDLIGTPFCITVDHDTLSDNTVTVRLRDTAEQLRIPIAELPAYFDKHLNIKNILLGI
jgi:glycyl-tRNA synthetase